LRRLIKLSLLLVTLMLFTFGFAVSAMGDINLYSPFSTTTQSSITLGSDAKPGKLNVGIRGYTDPSAKRITKNIIVESKSADSSNISQMKLEWPNGEGYSTNGVFDEITGVGFSSQTTLNIPARVVFTFDDGWSSVYSKAYQYMHQNGVKGTAYIVPTFLDKKNYMTSGQVQELYDNGWCIANHTLDHHNMSAYTYAQAYPEIQNWITWAQGKGYTSGLKHIAFPNGGFNTDVLSACTDLGLVTARTVGHSLNSNFSMYGVPPQLLSPLTCGLGGDSPDATAVDTQIANAVSQGKVAILMFHKIVDVAGKNGSSIKDGMNFVYSDFQQVVDYCKNNGILLETIDEFYNSLNTEIHAITDIQKTLEFNTNYQCIKLCDKVILDGTLAWTKPTLFQTNTYRAYVKGWCSSHPDVSNAVGSNHTNFNDLQVFDSVDVIKGNLANHYQVGVHTNGNLYISIDKVYGDANGLTTSAAIKEWLNSHPITMIYQKVTPVTTPVTPLITTNGQADTSLRGWGENTVISTKTAMQEDTTSSMPVLVETHRVDNDTPVLQPGELQFSAATYEVSEVGPTATIMVSRINGSTGAVGVTYATSNDTATAGSDYTTATGTLAFADGEVTKTFTVPITKDSAAESNETVILTLSSPTGGATLGTPSQATLTITDLSSDEIFYSTFSTTTQSSLTLGSDARPGKLNVGIRGNTDLSAKKSTKNVVITSTSADSLNSSQIALDWSGGEGYSVNGVFDEITGTSYNSVVNVGAKAILTFDDGWASVYTEAYPIMKPLGFVGTVYVVSDYVDKAGYLTTAQLTNLYANGWCLSIHSKDHRDMVAFNYADAYADIKGCQDWLISHSFTRGAYHISPPHGGYNDAVLQACKDLGIKTTRTIVNNYNSNFDTSKDMQLLNTWTCGAGMLDYSQLKPIIDTTYSQNLVSILMFHEVVASVPGEDGTKILTSDFTSLMNYLTSKGISVVTINSFSDTLNSLVTTERVSQQSNMFNNSFKQVRRVEKLTLDGSLAWINLVTIGSTPFYRVEISGWVTAHPDVLSRNFASYNDLQVFTSVESITNSGPGQYQVAIHTNGNLYLCVDKAYLDANGGGTLANLKAYLNSHPVTMVYQKVTPVTTPVTPSITTNGQADTSLRCSGNGTVITANLVSDSATPVIIESHLIGMTEIKTTSPIVGPRKVWTIKLNGLVNEASIKDKIYITNSHGVKQVPTCTVTVNNGLSQISVKPDIEYTPDDYILWVTDIVNVKGNKLKSQVYLKFTVQLQ